MDVKARSQARTYVTRRLSVHGDITPIGDGDLLFTSGRLDSLDAVEIVMSLEEDHGVDFAKLSFDLTLIDSIAAIAALIGRLNVAA